VKMTQKLVNFEIKKKPNKQTENEISSKQTVSKQKKIEKKVKQTQSQKRKFLLEKTLNMGTKFFLSPNDFSF